MDKQWKLSFFPFQMDVPSPIPEHLHYSRTLTMMQVQAWQNTTPPNFYFQRNEKAMKQLFMENGTRMLGACSLSYPYSPTILEQPTEPAQNKRNRETK